MDFMQTKFKIRQSRMYEGGRVMRRVIQNENSGNNYRSHNEWRT